MGMAAIAQAWVKRLRRFISSPKKMSYFNTSEFVVAKALALETPSLKTLPL
jgi:hypothetical protein